MKIPRSKNPCDSELFVPQLMKIVLVPAEMMSQLVKQRDGGRIYQVTVLRKTEDQVVLQSPGAEKMTMCLPLAKFLLNLKTPGSPWSIVERSRT